ncbi:hypothetical protein FQR65_LT08543 [Abscondita terminalis]|nr:hypothetical protein FQR65_LT08543 [Abscondita terminalis]
MLLKRATRARIAQKTRALSRDCSLSLHVVYIRRIMDVLISEVRKRPALWDKSHKFYRHRVYADKAWDAIAKITGISNRIVKYKWKRLRDSFNRELRKFPRRMQENVGSLRVAYNGKWHYFVSMLFLMKSIRFLKPECNVKTIKRHPIVKLQEEYNEVDSKTSFFNNLMDEYELPKNLSMCIDDNASKTIDNSRTTLEVSPKLIKKINIQYDKATSDTDLSFLQSLLPYFRKLSLLRKLHVRKQFHTILSVEIKSIMSKSSETVKQM